MPGIGGENIGTAFIRIIADGDGLDESIRRQFNESEPSIREGGKNNADSYLDAFNEQFAKDFEGNFGKNFDELMGDANTALTERMSRTDLAEEFFDSPDWKRFRERLTNESGVAGTLAGQRLEKRFRDSTNLEGLPAAIRASGPEIRRAQKDILEQFFIDARAMNKQISLDQKKAQDDQTKQLKNFFNNQRNLHKQFNDAVIKQRQDRDRQFDLFNKQQAEAERLTVEKITAAHVEALAENRRINKQKLKDERDMLADAYNDNKIYNGRLKRLKKEQEDRGRFDFFRREHSALGLLVKDINEVGDVSGRVFGRGSRNNFLNFTGSVVRNLIRGLGLIPRVLSDITDAAAFVGKGFSKAFTDAGGGLTGFFAGIGGGLGALGELAAVGLPALLGLAAAATIAVAALGPLVALASALLAAITALAGAISFALLGGLGLLAGAIAPIGFAVAGLAAAFIGLDDATKKTLKNAIKPVIDGVKELGAEVRKPILGAIIGQSAALGGLFSNLAPLFHGVGQSIAQTIRLIVRELTGPGGDSFFSAMTAAMPHAIVDLGEIFVHTFGGFGGILVGLIPSFQRLLDFLEGVTFRFSNFTNSARGQNRIKKFMDDAVESAKSLGRFLLEVGGLLGDLFSAGRATGNTIIDDMTEKVHEFRNFLAANPTALQDWFSHGLNTIRDVGRLIDEISRAFASLDTAANRDTLNTVFDGLIIGAKVAAAVIKILEFNLFLIRAAIGALVIAFAGLLQGLAFLLDGMSHVPFIGGMFKDAAGNVRDFAGDVFDLGNTITGLPPDVGLDTTDAQGNVDTLNGSLNGLSSPVVEPEVDVDPALSNRDRLALGLGTIPSPVITPEVDNGPAGRDMDGLVDHIDGFVSPVIEPEVDVGPAGHDLGRLRDDIGDFGSKRTKPAILKIITEGIPKAKADLGALRNDIGLGARRGSLQPLKIQVEAQADNARKTLKGLRDDMDASRSPVDLKVRTGSALGAITGLRKGIEEVKPKKPIEIKTKTGSALSAITGLRVGINSIPALKTTKMDLRAVQAKKNADSLADAVNRVKSKTTKIDTLTGQAKKNADSLRDAVGNVKSKTTTMTNNTNQAKKNTDSLRDAIGNVKSKTVTMTANTGAARGAVAALAAGINSLHDRTITITTLRNETLRVRREQVPLPGSGGNAPFAPSVAPQTVSTGKTVSINQLTLVSNSPDSRTAANEFLNSLVAASL